MLEAIEQTSKTSHPKCELCSEKMNCDCVGFPTFKNIKKTDDGKTLTPVRCDKMLRQEEGPYLRS